MTLIPKSDCVHYAYINFTIHSSDKEIKTDSWRMCSMAMFRTIEVIQDLNQPNSDIIIRMVIETKRFVDLEVIMEINHIQLSEIYIYENVDHQLLYVKIYKNILGPQN